MKIAHQKKKKLKPATQNWRKNIHQTYPLNMDRRFPLVFFFDLTSLVEPIARPDRWWTQGTHNSQGTMLCLSPQKNGSTKEVGGWNLSFQE